MCLHPLGQAARGLEAGVNSRNKDVKGQEKLCRDCLYWLKWATTKAKAYFHKVSICNLRVEATYEKSSCECWRPE